MQVGDGLLGSKPVVAVSCGQAHTLALAEGGDLWVWGGGEHGVLGLNSSDDKLVPFLLDASHFGGAKISQIYCGYSHSLAVTLTGECWSWGYNRGGALGHGDERTRRVPTPLLLPDESKVLCAACGQGHTLVVTDGR